MARASQAGNKPWPGGQPGTTSTQSCTECRAGKLIIINEIRERIAKKHGATIGCPITTGIFAWIAAHAADEAAAAGAKAFTPYWRTLKNYVELNPKYPGGIQRLKHLVESEGHTVVARGKKYVVEEFKTRLVRKQGGLEDESTP